MRGSVEELLLAAALDALLMELKGRRPDAREFALSRRVLLAQTKTGVDIDIAFGALPFEERTIERAGAWPLRGNLTLTTCSAEDLIVHKVFAGRNLDWSDAERVLTRQHGKLDLRLIRRELQPLLELKEQLDSMEKFTSLVATVERRLQPGSS